MIKTNSTRNKSVIVISLTYPHLAIAVLCEPDMTKKGKKVEENPLLFRA